MRMSSYELCAGCRVLSAECRLLSAEKVQAVFDVVWV